MTIYDYYIPKLLHKISKKTITVNAKVQVKQIMFHVVHVLIRRSIDLLKIFKKSDLDHFLLELSIKQYFTGELCENLLKEGTYYIQNPSAIHLLTFPTDYFKTIVKKYSYKYSFEFLLYLTAVMEYFTIEILDLANAQSLKCNSNKITPRNIFLAIHYDRELSLMCKSFNMQILGSGIIPTLDNISDSHKFVLSKQQFESMIKYANTRNMNISNKSITFLQYYIEYYLAKLMHKTDQLCSFTNKSEINKDDIVFVQKLIN